MTLTIKQDQRDGFYYVTEQIGKHRKQLLRGVTLVQVLKMLTIKYTDEVSYVANSEVRNESSDSAKSLGSIQ